MSPLIRFAFIRKRDIVRGLELALEREPAMEDNMHSRLNDMRNEGLVVIGREVKNEWADAETIRAVANTVEEWARKLSLPLGLVYCGTTINWPDDVDEFTPILVGLITFAASEEDAERFDENDEEVEDPVAGKLDPRAMDVSRAAEIPDEFWTAIAEQHGVEFGEGVDAHLAVAGWAWVSLRLDSETVLNVSAEDNGHRVIPLDQRGDDYEVRVGTC